MKNKWLVSFLQEQNSPNLADSGCYHFCYILGFDGTIDFPINQPLLPHTQEVVHHIVKH